MNKDLSIQEADAKIHFLINMLTTRYILRMFWFK